MRTFVERPALLAPPSSHQLGSRRLALVVLVIVGLGLAGALVAGIAGSPWWVAASGGFAGALALSTAMVARWCHRQAADRGTARAWALVGAAFGAIGAAKIAGPLTQLWGTGGGRLYTELLDLIVLGAGLLTVLLLVRQHGMMEERLRRFEERAAQEAQARAAAEAASDAKSAFLASMSHELRTPLTAILGYSELLQLQAEQRGLGDFSADLGEIERAGHQLLSMVNDVLDLAKLEAGTLPISAQRFDLSAFIADITVSAGPIANTRGNRFVVECPPDLGEVALDPQRLRQVIIHLLHNAGKFTDRGTIRLRAARGGRPEKGGAAPTDFTIEVHDSGIGMSPEQLERLFMPFSQAHTGPARPYDGSGVGLALSRRLCELMGGRIEACSAPDVGSTFTILLPSEMPAR